MVKIIFFDIDGTLLKFGETKLSDKIKYTLNKLRENGIKIFIATGRPNFIIPEFEGVEFDGYIAFNGQYCANNEQVIYTNPLVHEDVLKIVDNVKEMNHPIQIATAKQMVSNGNEPRLDEYFKVASQTVNPVDNFDKYLEEDVFQMMCAINQNEYERFLKGCHFTKITSWCDYAADIIPSSGGKGVGVNKVLEYYGFKKEESMAFGDGGNDVEMLEAVGISVAMENGQEVAKKVSNHICKSVYEDGVYYGCKEFGLID